MESPERNDRAKDAKLEGEQWWGQASPNQFEPTASCRNSTKSKTRGSTATIDLERKKVHESSLQEQYNPHI